MFTQNNTVTQSFPVFSLLTIVFVIAKLANVIDWSWWLVLLPLWGPPAAVLGIIAAVCLFLGFGYVVLCLLGEFGNRYRKRISARRLSIFKRS